MKPIEINKDFVLQDMQEVFNCYGKCTQALYKQHGKYNVQTVAKKLNLKFSDLQRELNIPTRSYNVNREDLIQDVFRIYNDNGYITRDLYIELGKYSRKPINRLFGSWNNMLQELGLPINCLINIPEEDLLNELRRIYQEYGVISATIIRWESKYSLEVYVRRFRGLNNAYKKIGIPTHNFDTIQQSQIETYLIQKIEKILGEKAEREKQFDWLIYKYSLRLDAYFPKHNLAVEINGPLHYINPFARNEAEFQLVQERFQHKIQLCQQHKLNFCVIDVMKPMSTDALTTTIKESIKF